MSASVKTGRREADPRRASHASLTTLLFTGQLVLLGSTLSLIVGCREAPDASRQTLDPQGSATAQPDVASSAAARRPAPPTPSARSLSPAASSSVAEANAAGAPPSSAAGSAFAPSPSASLRSAPSALGVRLGDPQPRVAELLGPCEAALGDVCIFWTRGLELELAAGQVQRMVAHSAGDASALVEGAKGRFSLFKGPIGQAQIGMTEDFLLNVLGGPTQRLVPLGKKERAEASLWEYAKEGLSVEVETIDGDSQIVRIHVPLAPARPAR